MIYIHKESLRSFEGVLLPVAQSCLKMTIKDIYELSIVFDNSCGALNHLSRASARIFNINNDKDLTNEICDCFDIHIYDFNDIKDVVEKIEKYDSEKT